MTSYIYIAHTSRVCINKIWVITGGTHPLTIHSPFTVLFIDDVRSVAQWHHPLSGGFP